MKTVANLVLALVGAALTVFLFSRHGFAAQSPFGIATPDAGGGFGGPLGPFFAWIAVRQTGFYKALTADLKAIRENGSAVWLLLGVSFVYGVFHAAGPGHGKAVITSFLLASGESARRGVAISFAAAFVQAATAVVVVAVAAVIFHATAQTMTQATNWMEIGSYAAIAVVGAWLLWSRTVGGGHHHHHHHIAVEAVPAGGHGRGDHDHEHSRERGHEVEHRLAHGVADDHGHEHHDHGHGDHDHDHDHEHHDHHGHAVAGMSEKVAKRPRSLFASAWGAILAVGIRPCSGAIIILVFALSQGLIAAGIAATFVMALGTGLTVAVLATLAVSARGIAMRFAGPESGAAHGLLRIVEIGGAAAVLLFGLALLGGALSSGLAA